MPQSQTQGKASASWGLGERTGGGSCGCAPHAGISTLLPVKSFHTPKGAQAPYFIEGKQTGRGCSSEWQSQPDQWGGRRNAASSKKPTPSLPPNLGGPFASDTPLCAGSVWGSSSRSCELSRPRPTPPCGRCLNRATTTEWWCSGRAAWARARWCCASSKARSGTPTSPPLRTPTGRSSAATRVSVGSGWPDKRTDTAADATDGYFPRPGAGR